ncbi:LacI family DNA-binding transcriptional regulator [Streptomyces sp. TRM66268-LWL]|uniref:LacI family DNA-binding transcriptional regulator n=1 Tax=Streptomyces polyasparticus TaxID=2767826 RepID=A0ABR7SEX2_9ACTN|nr:LacI family DNA-binding transcriptional regulator [Streptomyces polyasparticus]MBC9713142.1 LacI family DNA-binding transcriptional regulator [Streptomyces polyasparticus]
MPAAPRRATTIRDVAARAGVSPATVSRVLTGNRPVSPAIHSKVQRAIKELDYVVNAQARALSGTNTQTIAILIPDVAWSFHGQVAHGIEQQAIAEGRLSLICSTLGDPQREVALIEMLRQRSTEAVILVGGADTNDEYVSRIGRLAEALDREGSRLVLCGRPAPKPGLPVTVVDYDNEGGAYAAAGHLLSAGHRRIAFIGGTPGNTTFDARHAGYRRALADHGVDADPALTVHGPAARGFGHEQVRTWLAAGDLPCTAVFCFDDLIAAGVIAAARESGLKVPDDLSVLGYDDEPLAIDVHPALTTVHVPHEELGRTAVRQALHRDDPMNQSRGQSVTLGTHLVLRQSVRTYRRGA